MERQKWHAEHVPDDYPFLSPEKIKEVLKDLEYEYQWKLKEGKNNHVWEKLIKNHIEAGREQLRLLNKKRHWFSMDNPVIYILVVTIIALGSYLIGKFNLL